MIAAALSAIAAAMLLVRLGWSGRSGVAHAGWAFAIAALLALAWRDGAWGLAMGVVVGTVVAIAAVLRAGWTAPARARRPAREAHASAWPRWHAGLTRRLAVFVLVVPVGGAAAQWLAFGAQALARGRGAGAADATVLALFLQPVAWAGLMAWQMTRAGPARMIAAPAGAALAGTLLWSAR